jgi:Amt family ammonium transporter
MTFAIIASALIAGAFAERMKFSAMLWFTGLWTITVYAPVAHWVWGPEGFLNAANGESVVRVLDFAGGTVVLINAGVAGLMAAVVLGRRLDTGRPYNIILTFIGASLLWVGGFGLNSGSAISAGIQAGIAMVDTQVASATAAFTWMLVEWTMRGKPTLIGICTGAVAGLVAVTPASGFVGPGAALAIGVAAGMACYWGVTSLKHMLGYDDALDCFGIFVVGGVLGTALTGVFAGREYGEISGLIEGNPVQVANQLLGIVIVIAYCAIVSFAILKIVDAVVGLRVRDEVEREGLDLALHGEAVD